MSDDHSDERTAADPFALLDRTIWLLNQPASLEALVDDVLAAVGGLGQWTFCRLWWVGDHRGDPRLRSAAIWTQPGDTEAAAYARSIASDAAEVAPEVPSKVVAIGRPVWSETAPLAGLRRVLGIPVLSGDEVVGVLELRDRSAADPDPLLLRALRAIGAALGRAVERERATIQHHRLEAVLAATQLAFVASDEDGRITRWNPAATALFGWTPDEAIGRTVGELLVPVSLRAAHEAGMARAREGEFRILGRCMRLKASHKSGKTLPIDLTVNVVEYPGGREYIAFLQDVSALVEAQLRQSELDRASARVDALARSNRDLQEFAYAASHDLQEPLRTIAGYLELLDRRHGQHLDENGREFLGFAVDAATRMSRMLRDLLDYSRISTRAGTFGAVALGVALDEAKKNLALAISEAEANIEVGDLPVVHGDRRQLVQLFQNLLSNAVKFRGDAPARIHVYADPPEADTVRIHVADEGEGFEPESADRVFTLFRRLRTDCEGSGVGLAIAKKIVERHGGHIDVVTAPGAGADFRVTLRVHTSSADA